MLMELFLAVLKIGGVENQLEQNWRDSTEGTCYDLIESPLHNVVGQMWPVVLSWTWWILYLSLLICKMRVGSCEAWVSNIVIAGTESNIKHLSRWCLSRLMEEMVSVEEAFEGDKKWFSSDPDSSFLIWTFKRLGLSHVTYIIRFSPMSSYISYKVF